jgi:xylulokinase
MYLIGFDIGSSSVKASLINAEDGKAVASAFYPRTEMNISAPEQGWAEQDPELWWENLRLACKDVMKGQDKNLVAAIGISYQMHGLVMIDRNRQLLRPSIIWCDSRAIDYGEKAFNKIGNQKCLTHLLNSPGNFTASKLSWVKENEPEVYDKLWKIMLPGDYIAMKLTGEVNTTISGLSEGIMWDFKENKTAGFLLDYFGFDQSVIPEIVPVFSDQGRLLPGIDDDLGLPAGIQISYRAGDQPNNAFSLNVLNPGEIAATAGTSGVVYGISDVIKSDPASRVNSFAHVNHTREKNRLGVLLCVNGTGILYSWLRKNIAGDLSYDELNKLAANVKTGSDGLSILPFGNGAERMLENLNPGCVLSGLDFNQHGKSHLIRAGQEGVAFAFRYGMDIMKNIGIDTRLIRAGNSNMFLSPVFRETLAGITGATIELYDTDGSQGAAKGAGIGCGLYKNYGEAFKGLTKIKEIHPDNNMQAAYNDGYQNWLNKLLKTINN